VRLIVHCLQDFYDEELRLVVCGYIQPEADFTTLEALKERIYQDAADARAALKHSRLQQFAKDGFLQPSVS
jgi:FAD synthase